jgi:hypothetical protein
VIFSPIGFGFEALRHWQGGGSVAASVTITSPIGETTEANSVSVAIASDETVPVSGTVTTTPPANASTNLTQVGGAAVALGSATSAASIPTVIASDQGAVATKAAAAAFADGAVTTLGAAGDAAGATTIMGRIRTLISQLPAALGAGGGLKVDGSGTALPVAAAGDVASGVANSGNPLQAGGRAATARPAAVTDAQRVSGFFDKFGRTIVAPWPLDLQEQAAITIAASVASTALFAAGGAGVRHAVTHIHVSNTSATALRVDILDGATVIWSTYVAASGGGAEADFSVPLIGTANTALNAQCGTSVTDVRITAVGYQVV